MSEESMIHLLYVINQFDTCQDAEIKAQLKPYILSKLKELNGDKK